MTMRIRVMNRRDVEATVMFGEPHAFISIRTPRDPEEVRLPIAANTIDVLRLQFHDLDAMPTQPIPILLAGGDAGHGVVTADLFDEERARKVVSFVRKVRAQNEDALLIIHCDAGWSRSPGMAAAIEKGMLGRDDAYWFKHKTPNRLVYRTILNVIEKEAIAHENLSAERICALLQEKRVCNVKTSDDGIRIDFEDGTSLEGGSYSSEWKWKLTIGGSSSS